MTLREKKAAEKKAAEDKKALEAIFRPQTPPEVTDEAEGSGVNLAVVAALPEATEVVPTRDVVDRVPEVKNTSVVVGLHAGGQAKLKGKRTRGEHSGDKKKRSKRIAVILVRSLKIRWLLPTLSLPVCGRCSLPSRTWSMRKSTAKLRLTF